MKLSRHGFFSMSQHQLPFSILRSNPQENYPLHEHEFVELVIVTGGTGCYFTEKISYSIERGDIFIITPGVRHGYRDVKDLTLINILYNADSLLSPLADIGTMVGYHALFRIEPNFSATAAARLLLSDEQLEGAVSIVSKIEEEVARDEPGVVFFSKVFFLELIGHLSRCYSTSEAQKSPEIMRVAEAISYIEQNYIKDIEQDDLAKIANLSKSHFLHIFKKTTDTTPLLYQKLLRMEKACSLLTQSMMSITEVSYNCGYHDSNYFTRQFKKVMKMSPKQYRNNSRKIEMPDN